VVINQTNLPLAHSKMEQLSCQELHEIAHKYKTTYQRALVLLASQAQEVPGGLQQFQNRFILSSPIPEPTSVADVSIETKKQKVLPNVIQNSPPPPLSQEEQCSLILEAEMVGLQPEAINPVIESCIPPKKTDFEASNDSDLMEGMIVVCFSRMNESKKKKKSIHIQKFRADAEFWALL
jgi:hypothetical protein